MTHPDDADIIGTKPVRDVRDQLAGLDLFAQVTPTEAEAEIQRDFLEPEPGATPSPASRARDESDAFAGGLSEREREERIARIKREVREPLLTLAHARIDRDEAPGVTATDVRAVADTKGLTTLLGTQQRAWSWIATWFGELCREGALVKYRVAGMVVKRMSANGNEQAVYLHPYDHRARHVA